MSVSVLQGPPGPPGPRGPAGSSGADVSTAPVIWGHPDLRSSLTYDLCEATLGYDANGGVLMK